jgi:hypothetical protein
MTVAGQMAGANTDKEALAKELTETVATRKSAEKKEEALKYKLLPLMEIGERIGIVKKTRATSLDISDELFAALEKEFGKGIVRHEPNIKAIRELMETNEALKKRIPEKDGDPYIKVG